MHICTAAVELIWTTA